MILDFLLALVVFGIIITIVVFSHELGHFLGAKKTKTKVTEFAVGFPPFIWKKKKGDTLFSLGLIPFGGYNKIYGMDVEAGEKEKDSYTSKTTGEKMLIIILGVVGNIVLTIFLFYIFLCFSGFSTYLGIINPNYEFPAGTQENYLLINYIEPESIAEKAGLNSNDIVLSINEVKITNGEVLQNTFENTKGEELSLLIKERKTGDERFVDLSNDAEKVGVGFTEITKLSYDGFFEKFFSGFLHTYNIADYSLSTMGYIISEAFRTNDASVAANAVAGPVGIFAITKITMTEGILQLINITAIISLALAITNLLPLPALDGGKCIYLGLQKVNARVFTEELSEKIDQVGFICLIILGLIIVVKDFFQFKDIIF